MHNPIAYNKSKNLQIRDARNVLDTYMSLMRWKPGDKSMDVGCGDGDITTNELMPRMPSDRGILVAVDISPAMLEFASSNYSKEGVRYDPMDIESEDMVESYPDHVGKYDHVFSFDCLHWTQNHRRAMENIYKLLNKNGDFLLTLPVKHHIYESYKILSQYPKWKEYMKDYKKRITPFNYSLDPSGDFKNMLHSIGFVNVETKLVELKHTFDGENCLRATAAVVNPFLKRMPSELHQDYLDDYVKFLKKLGVIGEDRDKIDEYTYHNMIAYGVKLPK